VTRQLSASRSFSHSLWVWLSVFDEQLRQRGAICGTLTTGFGGVLLVMFVAYVGLFSQPLGRPQFTSIVLWSGVVLPAVFGAVGLVAGAVGGHLGGGRSGEGVETRG
jgi:hypothetical protein